jgi:septal ring factor EnvC (AmiA/AmiB activator)
MIRSSFALLLALTLIGVSAAHAVDSPSSDRIVKTMSESKQKVIAAEAEKRHILGSLYSIQKRMKKISNEKGKLTDQLFQAQDGVKSVAKVIATLEGQIAVQKVQLRKRLRALYKMSGQGYISILFSRTSASDLDETLRFMKIVTDNDYRLIRSYRENVATYKIQKDKLKAQVEKLVAVEKQIKKQESLLAVEQESKSKIVSELDKERTASLATIKTLRKKTASLQDSEVDELLRPSIYEQKGSLPVPYVSQITQDFGLITDDRFRIKYSHKGWQYAPSPTSSDVNCVFDGTIAKTQWIPGYGTTVVVDHGDHYYSVYGHLSRLHAKAGDTLKKGQIFAETGSKGLYFELRHFSEAENPARWITPSSVSTAQAESF